MSKITSFTPAAKALEPIAVIHTSDTLHIFDSEAKFCPNTHIF